MLYWLPTKNPPIPASATFEAEASIAVESEFDVMPVVPPLVLTFSLALVKFNVLAE